MTQFTLAPEVPDEEADSGDTYTVAFDHLMNELNILIIIMITLEMILTEKTHSLIQRTERLKGQETGKKEQSGFMNP